MQNESLMLSPKAKFVGMGLVIEESTTLSDWIVIGKDLRSRINRDAWAVADWLGFGDRKGYLGAGTFERHYQKVD